MVKEEDIIDYKWRTAISCVGFVAIKTIGGWKAYVGTASGKDEWRDVMHIANHGAKLFKSEAVAFFPHLNPEEFKI